MTQLEKNALIRNYAIGFIVFSVVLCSCTELPPVIGGVAFINFVLFWVYQYKVWPWLAMKKAIEVHELTTQMRALGVEFNEALEQSETGADLVNSDLRKELLASTKILKEAAAELTKITAEQTRRNAIKAECKLDVLLLLYSSSCYGLSALCSYGILNILYYLGI